MSLAFVRHTKVKQLISSADSGAVMWLALLVRVEGRKHSERRNLNEKQCDTEWGSVNFSITFHWQGSACHHLKAPGLNRLIRLHLCGAAPSCSFETFM